MSRGESGQTARAPAQPARPTERGAVIRIAGAETQRNRARGGVYHPPGWVCLSRGRRTAAPADFFDLPAPGDH